MGNKSAKSFSNSESVSGSTCSSPCGSTGGITGDTMEKVVSNARTLVEKISEHLQAKANIDLSQSSVDTIFQSQWAATPPASDVHVNTNIRDTWDLCQEYAKQFCEIYLELFSQSNSLEMLKECVIATFEDTELEAAGQLLFSFYVAISGIPEQLMDTGDGNMQYETFLSHSGNDKNLVGTVRTLLKDGAFFDRESLEAGDDQDVMWDALRACRVCCCTCSPTYVSSRYPVLELGVASARMNLRKYLERTRLETTRKPVVAFSRSFALLPFFHYDVKTHHNLVPKFVSLAESQRSPVWIDFCLKLPFPFRSEIVGHAKRHQYTYEGSRSLFNEIVRVRDDSRKRYTTLVNIGLPSRQEEPTIEESSVSEAPKTYFPSCVIWCLGGTVAHYVDGPTLSDGNSSSGLRYPMGDYSTTIAEAPLDGSKMTEDFPLVIVSQGLPAAYYSDLPAVLFTAFANDVHGSAFYQVISCLWESKPMRPLSVFNTTGGPHIVHKKWTGNSQDEVYTDFSYTKIERGRRGTHEVKSASRKIDRECNIHMEVRDKFVGGRQHEMFPVFLYIASAHKTGVAGGILKAAHKRLARYKGTLPFVVSDSGTSGPKDIIEDGMFLIENTNVLIASPMYLFRLLETDQQVDWKRDGVSLLLLWIHAYGTASLQDRLKEHIDDVYKRTKNRKLQYVICTLNELGVLLIPVDQKRKMAPVRWICGDRDEPLEDPFALGTGDAARGAFIASLIQQLQNRENDAETVGPMNVAEWANAVKGITDDQIEIACKEMVITGFKVAKATGIEKKSFGSNIIRDAAPGGTSMRSSRRRQSVDGTPDVFKLDDRYEVPWWYFLVNILCWLFGGISRCLQRSEAEQTAMCVCEFVFRAENILCKHDNWPTYFESNADKVVHFILAKSLSVFPFIPVCACGRLLKEDPKNDTVNSVRWSYFIAIVSVLAVSLILPAFILMLKLKTTSLPMDALGIASICQIFVLICVGSAPAVLLCSSWSYFRTVQLYLSSWIPVTSSVNGNKKELSALNYEKTRDIILWSLLWPIVMALISPNLKYVGSIFGVPAPQNIQDAITDDSFIDFMFLIQSMVMLTTYPFMFIFDFCNNYLIQRALPLSSNNANEREAFKLTFLPMLWVPVRASCSFVGLSVLLGGFLVSVQVIRLSLLCWKSQGRASFFALVYLLKVGCPYVVLFRSSNKLFMKLRSADMKDPNDERSPHRIPFTKPIGWIACCVCNPLRTAFVIFVFTSLMFLFLWI